MASMSRFGLHLVLTMVFSGCALSSKTEVQAVPSSSPMNVVRVVRETRAHFDSLSSSYTGKVLVKPSPGHALAVVEVPLPLGKKLHLTQADLADSAGHHYQPFSIGFASREEPEGVASCQGTMGSQPLSDGTVRYLVGSSRDSGERLPGGAAIRYPTDLECIPQGIAIEGGTVLNLSFEVSAESDGFTLVLNGSEVFSLSAVVTQ